MKKILILSIILASCSGREATISNFDNEIWKKDKLGCNDLRGDLYNILLDNEDQLLGLNESEIVEFLGRPDKTELYSRNQKFYIYLIEPGPDCGEAFKAHDPARIVLRFNATGLVSEITLYN